MYESVPAMKNTQQYISAIMKIPMMSPEEEIECVTKFKETGDQESSDKIIKAHLKMVISIARKYHGYNIPEEDLIQEGNIGLMQALNTFTLEADRRFSVLAVYYIKSAIGEYIMKNWKSMRVASSKPQRKLFFKMRSKIDQMKARDGVDGWNLSGANVDELAEHFDVSKEIVREMNMRLSHNSISLNQEMESYDGSVDRFIGDHLQHALSDSSLDPVEILIDTQNYSQSSKVEKIVNDLDPRSKDIILKRWMYDDDTPRSTFETLGKAYNVSKERIRQIETVALKKIRKELAT